MFAEDQGQPEVEAKPGEDSHSKISGGKEQATKKQYMEAEYDTGSKVPEKLNVSQFINDINVTTEIKYGLIQNKHHHFESSFHQRNTKRKRDHLDLLKDTANTAGSQITVKMGCIVQHVCCFTQIPRKNNQVCLFTSHTPIGKTLKSDLQNHNQTESHRMSKVKMDAFVSTYMKPSSKFHSLHDWKRNCGKEQKILTSIEKCLEFCGRQD